jgi:hypothetical protein
MTADYPEERMVHVDRSAFDRVLARVPDVESEVGYPLHP